MILNSRLHKTRRPMADINIVPYVDVMLVLLVIFMVTAPMLMQGVQVDLPKASSEALPHDQKPPIIVSVDAQGALYLNTAEQPEKPLDSALLIAKVIAELKQNPTRAVLIKGDKNANYGKVIHAMTTLKKAGVSKLGLMTEYNEARTVSEEK